MDQKWQGNVHNLVPEGQTPARQEDQEGARSVAFHPHEVQG